MAKYVRYQLKLDVPFEEFGWVELRNFMSRYAKALQAMPHGPTANDLQLLSVEEGSSMPVLRYKVPEETALVPTELPHVVLQQGPGEREWSPRMYQAAGDLWDYLRKKETPLVLCRDDGSEEPLHAPRPGPSIRELTSLEGIIHKAGGNRGSVEMDFTLLGRKSCQAGIHLAKKMAKHLYSEAVVQGEATREIETGRLLDFQIHDFDIIKRPKDRSKALTELQEAAGDAFSDFSLSEFLDKRRGSG
jgi:hypothetical protein